MKENKYDDIEFFEKYSQMDRSVKGLSGAGEWHALKRMLPSFVGKRVLDLGCGFGWHCLYAVEMGAAMVTGIDISEKMLEVARQKSDCSKITYLHMPVEDFSFPAEEFDIVISSLAFHYIEDFEGICTRIWDCLAPGGAFVFSVEHPVFTAYGNEDWYYDVEGNRLHWPVDNYFTEGKRISVFLGENVVKYHRTLSSYMGALFNSGFAVKGLVEPQPESGMLSSIPGMVDELRRPMMLVVSAVKPD